MVRHNPHHFVNIWEGRPFVHAWLGRVQQDRCVNSNKQSDHSPGGGAISPHVWMIPCILHLWALFLYVATTLSLVVMDGTCPTSLLWEVPSALFSFCLPILYFYCVSVQATSELSPSPTKRKNNSLFVHPRNCICPLCTWKFKYTESSNTNWRGNVECTTYVFTPRPETPYQKDSLMVVMDWTLQTLEVIPMLLILAGDVETNPGPLELTVLNLSNALETVSQPLLLGTHLGVKSAILERFQNQFDRRDIDGQKFALFKYIEDNNDVLKITWDSVATVVETYLHKGNLAIRIREKYCSVRMDHTEDSTSEPSDLESSSVQSSSGNSLSANSQSSYSCVEHGCGKGPVYDHESGKLTMLPEEEKPTLEQRPQHEGVNMENGGEEDEMRMDHTEDGSRLSSTSEPSDLESSSAQSSSRNSLSASSQSFYFCSECGCGKCSAYDLESDKPCPNPNRLPFPKCNVIFELRGDDNDVRPCTLQDIDHDGQRCMAMRVSCPQDDADIVRYAYILQASLKLNSIVQTKCIHYDSSISAHPIVVFESKQSFVDYCSSSLTPTLTDIDQMSFLFDIAESIINLQGSCPQRVVVTEASIFVQKEANSRMRALFCPLYGHSCFPQPEPGFNSLEDLKWISDIVSLMHHRSKTDENIPESHILYNILHKWLAKDERRRPQSMVDVAKELEYLLGLEKDRIEMLEALNSSDPLDITHLHMFLIGHTGVGKTSIRKHLQNIPIDRNEESTVIMEPERLCQETIEASKDSTSFVFKRNENVYKSEPGKIFLTLWDTGGQPMFQDLLPCFAKVRSIYGVVFRLTDLLDSSKAVIRPTACSLECEQESPYTNREYIRRCLAFLNSFSIAMHQSFSTLPAEVKNVFETVERSFPKVVLIGTYSDKVREFNLEEKEVLREESQQLGDSLKAYHLLDRTIRPDVDGSVLFEIDNTRSGDTYEDPGMRDLRKHIVSCTRSAKIPSEWISFKIDLEQASRRQQPFTGVITLEKAKEVARKTNAKVALSYFHELGIFLWYHNNQALNEYVIVEPKQLLNTLGTILNPAQFKDLPDKWKHLCDSGVVDDNLGECLLKRSTSGLPFHWVLAFLVEHHLAICIPAVGYYIPSMLQVRPICSNNLHVHDITTSSCSNILQSGETCPIFIVPKLECIPPGLFPRLLTALVGIENSSIKWSVQKNGTSCRNVVTLVVNETIHVVFTEFINCIRFHYSHYVDTSSLIEVSREIISNLKIQLQRVLPYSEGNSPLSITFACTCQKDSKPHFLLKLPYASDDEIVCSVGTKMELTSAHKMWLQDEPTRLTSIRVHSNSDAELLFQEAIKKGSISLNVTNILFTGMSGADVTRCKNVILGDAAVSDQTPLSVNTGLEHSFFVVKSKKGVKELKLLQHEDMDNLFADYIGSIEDTKAKREETIAKSKRGDTNTTTEDAITASGQTRVTDNIVPDDTELLSASEGSIPDGTDSHDIPSKEGKSLSPLSNVKTTIPEDVRVTSASSTEIERSANTNELLSLITRSSVKPHHNFEIVHVVDCTNSPFLAVLPIFIPNLSLCVACADLTHDLEKCVSFKVPFDNTKQMISHCSPIASKMLIIGTHTDPTTISKQNKALKSCSDRLVSNGADTFFPIDVFSTDSELLLPIREKITSFSTGGQSNPVPFFWHLLGNKVNELMKTVKRNVISKAECLELTEKLDLSTVNLSAALSHMHDLGLLYYFEKTLPDVIFGNITIFSTIITAISVQTDSAIVTERDFQEIKDVYVDELFTSKDAIKLFLDLFIITAFKKNSFIMPCLLSKVLHKKELRKYCVQDFSVAPLVINYPKRHGIFSCLVSFLASPYNNNPWTWNINAKDSSSQPSCLFRNCVQFVVPGYNTILTLFDSESSLVVYVQFPQNLCSTIKEGILIGLKKSHEHLHYDVQTLQCAENESWENNDKERIEGASGDLTVHNAFRVLLPFSEKWYNIGLYLGLDNDMMSTISVNYRHRPDLALYYSIKLWFHNSRNAMWADLINPIPTLDVGILKHQALQPLVNMSIQHGCSELFKYLTKVQRYEFKGDHLLLACKHDNEELVHYLLTELNCSPNVIDSDKLTPLVITRNKRVIKLLLQHGADANVYARDGHTPLYHARNQPDVIQLLLRHGANPVNPYKKYKQLFGKHAKNPPKLCTKIIVGGDSGAGKTTFVEALQKEKSFLGRVFTPSDKVTEVESQTAGIAYHEFESREYGKVNIMDLAGHRQYINSHSAVVKRLSQTNLPIAILVTDVSKSDDETVQSLAYWLNYFENQFSANTTSQNYLPLIVVGSHIDQLSSEVSINEKTRLYEETIASFSGIEYTGFIPMNCQLSDSPGMTRLRKCLKEHTFQTIEQISFNTHCLYIYLVEKYGGLVAVTLGGIQANIVADRNESTAEDEEVCSFLPDSFYHLCKLCADLNDRGVILFLKDTTTIGDSWVVLNKNAILSEVNGTIFQIASQEMRQYTELANVTGIVPLSKLKNMFPKYNTKMIVGVLKHFEICQEVCDQLVHLINTNDNQDTHVNEDEHYLFFPHLVRKQPPESLWQLQPHFNFHFGWILRCTTSLKHFLPRFQFVLINRLAFKFALALNPDEIDHTILALQRKCKVWENGIFWGNQQGIETLVEVDTQSKHAVLLMRKESLTPDTCKLRFDIIQTILKAAEEFCPKIDMSVSLIAYAKDLTYPLRPMSELTLVHLSEVIESISKNFTLVIAKDGRECIPLRHLVGPRGNTYEIIQLGTVKDESLLLDYHANLDKHIDQIAQRVGLESSQLDKPCSCEHLLPIAKKLANWYVYADYLQLTPVEVEAIQRDTSLTAFKRAPFVTAPHQRPFKMLKRWYEKTAHSPKAHYRYLLKACLEVGFDTALAKDICELVKEIDQHINQITVAVGIDPVILDQECSLISLLPISQKLTNWSAYTTCLGLSPVDQQSILTNISLTAPHQKCHKMLEMWQQRCAGTLMAHYRHLIKACLEVDNNAALAGDICRIASRHNSVSPDHSEQGVKPKSTMGIGHLQVSQLESIQTALQDVQHKWRELGSQLQLDQDTIELVAKQNHHKEEHCLKELLTRWLSKEGHGPPTLDCLIKALCSSSVDQPHLVEGLERSLQISAL